VASKRDLILHAAVGMIAQNGVRGLRVEEIAAKAGASTGLIYYHFKDRAGLLRATLDYISERAERHTAEAVAASRSDDPREALEQVLQLELQDTDEIRENSTAWSELRASAVFETDLREQLQEATRQWVQETAERIEAARDAGQAWAGVDARAAAFRLTSLVEGLSERWLSGSVTLERARELLHGAIDVELGPTPPRESASVPGT
jgi:AcrR family transcriptional regulator